MYCGTCGNDLNGNEYRCPACGAEPDYANAVKLALEGNERGFSFLYEISYKSKLYIAMKYMKDEDRALDVLQDSYIKAFAKLDTLRDPKTFPKWLSTIVASTALDALKKKNPVLFTDLQNEDESGEAYEYTIADEDMSKQPEMACTVQETQEMVRELINSLSDEQRMCVLMFHVEGYSIKEIAATLGCSENTVKSRLNYGRQNIKVKAEELQKKGYKLYSFAPITLLLYLIWSDMGAELANGTLSQLAGTTYGAGKAILQNSISASGRVPGGMQITGGGQPGSTSGGMQSMSGNPGSTLPGSSQGTLGNPGSTPPGGSQGMLGNPTPSGGMGNAAGAGRSIAEAAVKEGTKKAVLSTVGGKIAVAVAAVAVVGITAGGVVMAKKISDRKLEEQSTTTEAVAVIDDTASSGDDASAAGDNAQAYASTADTADAGTEAATTEVSVDESAYKAAYKKVLESYHTQVDNYFWQYDFDIMTHTANEEQTPIAFADITGDGVPEMILLQSKAADSAGNADLDIYSFDGDKAIQIFGTDLIDDMMGWDVGAASGTSYFLFTDKDGTLCAYSGFGDEGYTDTYMKFQMDASGMLQIDPEWSKTTGPNEEHTDNILICKKNDKEVSETEYDDNISALQKNADNLLIFNERGRDKAAEFFGNTDDTAMTYDEAIKYLGDDGSSDKTGKSGGVVSESDYKSAYLNVLEKNETAIANYDIQYPVSDNEFGGYYRAKKDVHAGRESEPVAFADITGDGVPEMFVMACPDGKNSVDASPELYIYSYSGGEVKNIYDKTKVEYAPEWDLNTEYFIFKEKGDDSLYVFSIMPGANAWEGYWQYAMGKDGYLEKIHKWSIGRNNEDTNATADDAIAICDGKKMNKADYDAMKENWWKNAETLILYNGDGESKIKEDKSGLLEKSANMTYADAVEYLKSEK